MPQNSSSVSTSLRLPQVTLPVYKGRPNENLNRFTNTLASLLKSSGVPSRHWTTYLKQQVQDGSRAYDIVDRAEQEHAHILGENPQEATETAFVTYYNKICESLLAKRGKPKDEHFRELLQIYYSMEQGPSETVSEFAHRFRETQYELEQHVRTIHYTPPPNSEDTELRQAFIIKLRPEIKKQLLSRGEQYQNLQTAIDAAERIERQFPPDHERSLYVDHFKQDKLMLNPYSSLTTQKTCYICGSPDHLKKQCKIKPPPNSTKKEICNMWNNLSNSPCDLSNGRCKYNRLHQCKQCKKQGCKAVLHTIASLLSPSNPSDGTVQTPEQAHPA